MTGDGRPRVLILGGGFAGVGAAQKLKKAGAEVVLVDRHDYHTFQPLLYQLATGLLETTAVGHSLRDLLSRHDNTTVHKASVSKIDLGSQTVEFDEIEPIAYDYLVFGLGAEVNFFGAAGAPEHAFPMYTLPHAVRLKDHILERWEAADRDPSLIEDGALNIVVVGGGPTGVETAGALAELYRGGLRQGLSGRRAGGRADRSSSRPAPSSSGCSSRSSASTPRRRSPTAASRCMTGKQVASVEPTRVALKSGETLNAHTLVWGAGLQGNPLVQSLGLELQRGNRIAVGPDLALPDHPEVYVVGDVAAITDAKTEQVLPQLGSVALQRVSTPARPSPPGSRGRSPSPSNTRTRGRWRPSAAARPSSRCSAAGR